MSATSLKLPDDLKRRIARLAASTGQTPHAFEVVADHLLLCRGAEDGRRELVLSRGMYGYIAKYRWLPTEDVVLILAVRHQREAGYTEEQ
ncbi:MAG: type II toxin-antitoxin system RelE/ParE family toxin [Proteobacteria bacterium]|nr:type II toxin-antitoxin system RelE/ParE family toxin [Pseudomonadota bacterium]